MMFYLHLTDIVLCWGLSAVASRAGICWDLGCDQAPESRLQRECALARICQEELYKSHDFQNPILSKVLSAGAPFGLFKRHPAVQVLQELQPGVRDLLQQRQLQVRLQGLQYMNDEPGAMHVVYLGVKNAPAGSGEHASLLELQQICKEVVQAFDAEGLLLTKDSRRVLAGLSSIFSAF